MIPPRLSTALLLGALFFSIASHANALVERLFFGAPPAPSHEHTTVMPLSTYQRGATPTAIILWQGATHRVQPGDQLQRWHVASIDAQGVLLTQSSAATKPAPVPARPVRVSTDPAPDWIAVIGRRLGIPASILAAVELQLTRSPGGRMGLQLPASEWLVAGPNQAFEPGDIVLSVNGIGLNRPQDLSGELERVDGSKPLRIEIARNGRLLMVEWFWLES